MWTWGAVGFVAIVGYGGVRSTGIFERRDELCAAVSDPDNNNLSRVEILVKTGTHDVVAVYDHLADHCPNQIKRWSARR